MTDAATAALAPEPIPGSGAGVTADDITETISWADFRPGSASSPAPAPARTRSGCAAASTPST